MQSSLIRVMYWTANRPFDTLSLIYTIPLGPLALLPPELRLARSKH